MRYISVLNNFIEMPCGTGNKLRLEVRLKLEMVVILMPLDMLNSLAYLGACHMRLQKSCLGTYPGDCGNYLNPSTHL